MKQNVFCEPVQQVITYQNQVSYISYVIYLVRSVSYLVTYLDNPINFLIVHLHSC
jgi:hypothetical protein